jgi:hypothetical protein
VAARRLGVSPPDHRWHPVRRLSSPCRDGSLVDARSQQKNGSAKSAGCMLGHFDADHPLKES